MSNIRFIDNPGVSAFGAVDNVNNATSSSFATSASFASNAITASHALFAVSASIEVTKEISSSHANRADIADSGNGIFSGSFSGSYEGNGSGLTNIPASGIVGLNLSQIADGTATASISETNGFIVNTDSKITGSLEISGSSFKVDTSGTVLEIKNDGTFTLGKGASSSGREDVAIGFQASAGNTGAISIGTNTSAPVNSVTIGRVAASSGQNSVVIGGYASNQSQQTVALGYDADISTNSHGSIAIGAYINTNAANNITFNATNINAVNASTANTFGVYMTSNTTPDFQVTNTHITASGNISGSSISTASFGTYLGDGSQLSGITPTAGSSAGRVVFTTTNGELTAESGFEYDSATDQLTVQSLNVTHLTSSFITASTIQTSGSNIFGDDTTDTQTLIGTTIMTGSAQVTGSVNITSGSLKIRGTTSATGASLFEIRSSAADAYDDLYTFDDNGKVTHEVSGAGDKYVIQTTSGAPMFKFGVSAGSQGYLKIQNNDFTGAYLSHQGGAFGYGATIPSSGISLLVKGDAQITGSLTVSGSGGLTVKGPLEVSMTASSGTIPLSIKAASDSSDDVLIQVRDDGGSFDLMTFDSEGRFNMRGTSTDSEGAGFYASNGGVSNDHVRMGFTSGKANLSISANASDKFEARANGVNNSPFVGITGRGTLALGTGASAGTLPNEARTNTMFIAIGTAPTTAEADNIQFFAQDVNGVAGTASPTFLTEDGQVLQLGVTSSLSYVSASAFKGDGSQLTGISAGTDLTQSLFVSPSGNDGTATVGDITKPFQTILAATASANIGDTIFIYPGIYEPSSQILKDRINYYFYPGAIVSVSSTLMEGTFEKINVRGYGVFDVNGNIKPLSITANGYFECDKVLSNGLSSMGSANVSTTFGQNSSYNSNEILEVKGQFNVTGSGNAYNGAINFGNGNIVADIKAFSDTTAANRTIIIGSDTADLTLNTYSVNKKGSALYSTTRITHARVTGHYESVDESNYYAILMDDGYIQNGSFDCEIIGAIKFEPGNIASNFIQIDGYQKCANSPSSLGAIQLTLGGRFLFKHGIEASETIFYLNHAGVEAAFEGNANITGNNSGKLFDIRAGKLVWNGNSNDVNIRVTSNEISGGELIINSPLRYGGQEANSNREVFNLSGGTLEINNKVIYHNNLTGSGIVDMTGGYLKLNGAQLINGEATGSIAYAIKLNNGTHSGSIFNNSFTNLTPFGPGSFTNEIVGGGTLFETDKLY